MATRGPASYAAVLAHFDALPPDRAVVEAWLNEGPNPEYHRQCKAEVRRLMPMLARQLERLAVGQTGAPR